MRILHLLAKEEEEVEEEEEEEESDCDEDEQVSIEWIAAVCSDRTEYGSMGVGGGSILGFFSVSTLAQM